MAGKMTEDLSRGFDDLQEGIKSIQKIIDQKIDDYKKATIHSLDVDLNIQSISITIISLTFGRR